MRLFVAIPVGDEVAGYADALRSELNQSHPDVKWVKKENYHLTLKFLGEVDAKLVPEIRDRLMQAAEYCPPFYLETRGIGYFPNHRRPRVIWAGIRGETDKADFLGERIDAYLAELGFEPEKKRSFHLTLGRVRSELSWGDMQVMAASTQKNEQVTFRIVEFYLMESRLSQRGPEYTVLGKFSLTG